jgi:hypothetical protein
MIEKPYQHIDTAPRDGTEILVWCESFMRWLPVFDNNGQWDAWGSGVTPEPGHAVWWQPMPDDPDRAETEAAWNALPEVDE